MNLRPTAKELNIAKRKLQGFLTNELAQRTSKIITIPFVLKDQLQSPRIPNEIFKAVLEYVDAITLARVSCACKLFFNIVLNGKYWHVLSKEIMNKLNLFPAWRVLLNVNETKKAIYATLHTNSSFLKEACRILNWFALNQPATLDQEINAKSALEKLFRTKYSTNPWKVTTIGREKFENDVTELKKCLPPTIQLQYDSNEIHPTLYIRIDTSSENHIYPRQTVRFYIPVSDSYPRERPFVYCEPPIYHPFINQATGVVSLEDIEKHSQYIQNQVINNDSYVIRSLNSSLSVSGSTTPVTSPSKLSSSTSSIVNNTNSNNNALSAEKIERLTASLEIAAKSPISDEITCMDENNTTNKIQPESEAPIVECPPITVTTTNTNQIAPNTPSTPVSSSPHTPSTPSSSTSSTSTSSNFSSPFCSPYRSEGQNVLKAVVDALQNLFVDTSYLTNYMNF